MPRVGYDAGFVLMAVSIVVVFVVVLETLHATSPHSSAAIQYYFVD